MNKLITASAFLATSCVVFAQASPCFTAGYTTNSKISKALENGNNVRAASIVVEKSSATTAIVRLEYFTETPDLCVEVTGCSGELAVKSSGSCDKY